MITPYYIPVQDLIARLENDQAGATILFIGTVRNVNKEKEVLYLEYEAFKQLAEKMINNIIEDAKSKFNLIAAVCVHRVGKLNIGDTAVAVITVATHRQEAYMANQFIIDRVKHEAPIWKKEYWADGTYAWGHNCNCNLPHKDLQEYLLHHQ
ncbi:MAG: molybdenum cofactor biosynthesis protein MoaE [Bacteroidota bacterium]|nr:molybdenum cofactor biosynthesis protein MoaE [Bacteroidota bacterium]